MRGVVSEHASYCHAVRSSCYRMQVGSEVILMAPPRPTPDQITQVSGLVPGYRLSQDYLSAVCFRSRWRSAAYPAGTCGPRPFISSISPKHCSHRWQSVPTDSQRPQFSSRLTGELEWFVPGNELPQHSPVGSGDYGCRYCSAWVGACACVQPPRTGIRHLFPGLLEVTDN